MRSIPKVVGFMSCWFLLCLGLSNMTQAGPVAQAGHPTSPANPTVKKGNHTAARGERVNRGHRIEGEVLRVEDNYYFVKDPDGREVRVLSDQSTRKIGKFSEGNRIVAVVDDQNHARSIRLTDMADMSNRRNEKTDRAMDSIVESGKTSSVGP